MNYTIGSTVFGDWKIVRAIGEGSFGTVFEIQKTDFGITSRSALKVITVPKSQADIRMALSEGMDERSITTYFQGIVDELVKEIAIMSSLKAHAGIVSCEDHKVIPHSGDLGWDILIRMELLTPLTEYQMTHSFNEMLVRKMAMDLTSALVFCQKKALIHRDIKPENIFVSLDDAQFKLGDFGVARTAGKTTAGLSKKGTEVYMAPEVYLAQPYGCSVDVYSLGLVLYKFMNHGRLPFLPAYPAPITFADRENALAKRMQGVPLPPPASATPDFARIILKACSHHPSNRYLTAADMLADLQRLAPLASATAPSSIIPDNSNDGSMTIGIWGKNTQPDFTEPSLHPSYHPTNAPSYHPTHNPSYHPSTAAAPQYQTSPMQQTPPMQQVPPMQMMPPVTPTAPKSSSKKGLFIGLGIGAAVLVIIIAIIAIVTLSDDSSSYLSAPNYSSPTYDTEYSDYDYYTEDEYITDYDTDTYIEEDNNYDAVAEAGFDYTTTPLWYTIQEEVGVYFPGTTDYYDTYSDLPTLISPPDIDSSYVYVLFDPLIDASPADSGYTIRGIGLESTYDDVAAAYGTAFQKIFSTTDSWLYESLLYLDEQNGTTEISVLYDCSYYCVYRLDPQWHIEFYFNDYDEVILFTVVYGNYDKNLY